MPLVHCSNSEHKQISREVRRGKKIETVILEDPAQLCFVNTNGAHITPRKCECKGFSAPSEDRKISAYQNRPEFASIAKELPADKEGRFLHADIPGPTYRKLMFAIHGKANPRCLIEDPHEPIDTSIFS